jgi:hypothetical protein
MTLFLATVLTAPTSFAQARPPDPWAPREPPEPTVRVSLRGVAETWDDSAIGSVYRTGMFAPGAAVGIPLTGPVSLELEGAYRRIKPRDGTASAGLDARMEVVPLVLTADIALKRAPMWTWSAGVGPSLTVFSERHPENVALTQPETPEDGAAGNQVIRGARLGLEARTRVAVDTGLFEPSRIPGMAGPSGLDIEILAARRFTRPGAPGMQLGAWRLGVGVAFRL